MKKTILITTIFLLTHCSLLFAQGQPAPKAGEALINVLTICMDPITTPSWDGSRLEIVKIWIDE